MSARQIRIAELIENLEKLAQLIDLHTICAGKVESGKTTFTVDLTSGVVVVRNVPAFVCTQCGEEWINDPTTIKLEAIAARAKEQNTQIEVMAMR